MVDESVGLRNSLHTFTLFDAADVPATGLPRNGRRPQRSGSRMISSDDILFLPGLVGGMAVNSMPADVELPKTWDFQKARTVLCIVRLLRGDQ